MAHNNNVFVVPPIHESSAANVPADCISGGITLTAASRHPQGEIEEELARIWSETLKVSYIGRNDGFLELGGDSLLAITVLHKIQEVFGLELPVRAIFELQTIQALAETIDNIYIETIEETMNEDAR